ncbi:MAG: alpha/beta hydrolase [Stellaceae bacterium]
MKPLLFSLLAGLALAGAAAPAAAQSAALPPEVRAEIAAMGPVLTPDLVRTTMEMFAPLAKPASLAGIKLSEDLAYGTDDRNKLDLFQPEGKRHLPVLVFIPGGGFVGGNKHSNDAIYANVGAYFARHGMLAIIANYRLAPQHPWPAGAEDVGQIIAWVEAHAAAYGGNPRRIFLMGHSAGATHVASYLFDASLHPKQGAGIVGAILVSGFYEVTPANLAPNITAYFGADHAQFAQRSPITHVTESKVPVFIAMAEYDPPFLEMPSLDLAARVCARDGKCPRLAWLKGHNHISEVASINTKDEALSRQVLDFVRTTR